MDKDYNHVTQGNVDFLKSCTRENLMRAFAGESQARNRYTFASSQLKNSNFTVLSKVFDFTAGQELAHAQVFYGFLSDLAGQSVRVDGKYPVDLSPKPLDLLRTAQHNERQEWENDYARFAQIAYQEGFELIGHNFEMIAGIEKTHSDRFGFFADLVEQDRLFRDEEETAWLCLNCGQVVHATVAPNVCPVCRHGQDWFVRLDMAPYTKTR